MDKSFTSTLFPKRHLTPEESEGSRSKSRRIVESRNREEKEEPGGFLDLNASPRGFDLNAPVAEEDSSHGQSGWLPAQDDFEGKADTAESKRSVVEEAERPQPNVEVEHEGGAEKSEESESSCLPAETDGGAAVQGMDSENEKISVEEACDEPELNPTTAPSVKPPVPATLIFQRTLEPLATLGIDDDLDILKAVWSAHQLKDVDTLDTVLVEACEELARNPSNPSRYHYLSCLYISKKLPEVFGLPKTFKLLLGFLRSLQPTVKRQMMLPVLASRLLLRAFACEPDWPFDFVQIYLEDATLSRSWIEHDGCKEFVSNVLTAFPDVHVELPGSTEDSTLAKVQDTQGASGEMLLGHVAKTDAGTVLSQEKTPMKNRYPSEEMRTKVRREFLQALNQLLGSPSTKENPRQLLKLMMQGAGYEEVRVVASSMVEGYLNNPVHMRAAKALLDRILQHTRGTSDNDLNTVANLFALRTTTVQFPGQTKSVHADMVTQLVRRRPEYTTLALKTFVTAEVNNRNLHNIKNIVMVLKAMPESPPPEYELALVLQELAANDDYRLQLRDLVRRMMKQVGPEIDVHALCHGLMQPWPAMGEQHEGLKEVWLKQLVDLSCQLLLLAVVPFALDENVVSAITSSSTTSVLSGACNSSLKEKMVQLEKFSVDTASFQVQAVAWCTDVLAIYLPSMDEARFIRFVRQLLFLENSEVYYATCENVSEVDLVSFRLLTSCLPAPEEILARLILMAISNHPVSQGEALKIIECLVWRAAAFSKYIDGALSAASVQLPAAIFKLASFNLPGVTRQPVAQLLVKDMYWRACLVVLIIAAYNPSTIGWFVWENLPTVRCLMESLLTCTRTFLPIGADESRFSEVKRLELEAEQRDSKAEEAISAFLDSERRRNDPNSADSQMSSPGSHTASQGEWIGKVMFLNQTGPVRRPPKSAVDELDRVDATYQLGHLLRKSRSPDFFAEITKLQTLPQAWHWLQKILVRASEVITYLPPVWQCELLFMHEGKHPLLCKLSLDIGRLRSHLCQVMVQQVPSKDGDLESVVNFLSHKLISKSGLVRVRTRRCFSYLFYVTSSSSSEHNISLPSSPPQDSKKIDVSGVGAVSVAPSAKGGINATSGETALGSAKKVSGASITTSQSCNTSASVVQVSSTSLSGVVLRASPGVSHTGVQDRVSSWTQVPPAGDDCGWLEILERVPTATRVVSVLAPAIQQAIQQENSIPVVRAYLQFLKRHLSRMSLACCIAIFIVHRKMLASSLLLVPPSSFIPEEGTVNSGQSCRTVTIELVLESLCNALESGTVNNLNWDEHALIQSPVVTLVTCHFIPGIKEPTLSRVQVHKIVVDSALEVLSLLGQVDTDDKQIKEGFQQLLNILFPALDNADHSWRWDVDVPMGWLEDVNGKQPMLSELKAVSFVRSKNTRLIKAGLSVLPLESKLGLCESFGLSSVGATALFNDLNPVKDTQVEDVLGPGSFAGKRLKKLITCVSTIVKAENKDGSILLRTLEKLVKQSTLGRLRLIPPPSSRQEKSKALWIETSEEANLPEHMIHELEEVTKYTFEWLTLREEKEYCIGDLSSFADCFGHYRNLRQHLQSALMNGWGEGINNCVNIMFTILDKAKDESLADSKFRLFGLPILALLAQHIPVRENTRPEGLASTSRHRTVYFIQEETFLSVKKLLDLDLQRMSSRYLEDSGISMSALAIVKGFKKKLASTCQPADRKINEAISQDPDVSHSANCTNDTSDHDILATGHDTFSALELASVDRFEAVLRHFLHQKLLSLWVDISVFSDGTNLDSVSTSLLPKNLVDLLRRWRWRDKHSAESTKNIKDDSLIDVGNEVEYSGRCGLVLEILGILDAEFQADGRLKSIFDLSQLPAESEVPFGSCILPVSLCFVVHKSSWNTVSKVFRSLLGIGLDRDTNHSRESDFRTGELCEHISGAASQNFKGLEALMEFFSLCVQHPRAKLACRAANEKSSLNLTWAWLDSSSARILTKLAISACLAAKPEYELDDSSMKSSNLWIQKYIHEVERKTLCPQNQCLKMLLVAASQGSHIMSAIVQQLSSYEESVADGLSKALKAPGTSSVKAVAHNFLQGLYLAFPVSVKALLHSSGNKLLLKEEWKSLNGCYSLQGQTCSLNSVLHAALRSICNGNEKQSLAAYGFSQEIARQHPLLVIPHLSTLRVLLQELLPLLKQGESQARATAVRGLSMGLGLLDALRPLIMLISNSNHRVSRAFQLVSCPSDKPGLNLRKPKDSESTNTKTGLETILDLYFEILRGLDVHDRPILAKVVARFSDFLCHCVAAGGRSREYVAAHRTPLLETTAQNFAKHKKIGFLLSLLDKPEVTPKTCEMSASGHLITLPPQSVSYPQSSSSSIALDDILKVRAQLQLCIKMHAGDSWKEQGLAFYSTGKSFQVSHMDENLEEGNLSATLNDLERASARMPAILRVLEDSLVKLTKVKDGSLRERIYNLLERSLLHCPSEGSASNIVEGLLQQLQSSDVLRAKSAARNASRFFHFSPELQESILVEMLQLGRDASDDLQLLLQGLFTIAGGSIL